MEAVIRLARTLMAPFSAAVAQDLGWLVINGPATVGNTSFMRWSVASITDLSELQIALAHCHTAINECSEGTSNCEQLCTDTGSSFVCSCRTGFTLASNRANCLGKSRTNQARTQT